MAVTQVSSHRSRNRLWQLNVETQAKLIACRFYDQLTIPRSTSQRARQPAPPCFISGRTGSGHRTSGEILGRLPAFQGNKVFRSVSVPQRHRERLLPRADLEISTEFHLFPPLPTLDSASTRLTELATRCFMMRVERPSFRDTALDDLSTISQLDTGVGEAAWQVDSKLSWDGKMVLLSSALELERDGFESY